ncbi:MAG: DUF3300 domain-containing protein [Lysobacterales bacterium]|nr:MAG: DUF3300 domain-containing protein [Xanthomonadales bacterium]
MKSLWLGIVLICSLQWLPAGVLAQDEPAAAPAAASATAAEVAPPEGAFAPDQLEQLVAPIALYPDALLMQILMAATYPLEIVQADRFVKQNPELAGEALDQALLKQDWDPSVKSLCTLPSVLKQMSENLDWTQDLGDAFLAQQDETLDTVQRMRNKAYEAGNLQTTEQQVVTQQEDKIIVIQSAEPEVVYVPTYSSTVVYGSSWGYPSYYYPPMYYPPPPGYGLISFGVGMAVGAAIWGDCNWGWGGNDVNIDIDRYNEFNRNTNINADRDRIQTGQGGRGGDKAGWQHDSSHRKGVNYKSPQVAQQHGAGAGSSRVTKDQARGRSSASTGSRQQAGTTQARDRSAGASGARTSQADRSAGSSGARSAQADRSSSNRSSQASRGNSAYSGSRSPSTDRMSSSRGASSRGAASYGGSRGGARSGSGRRR